MNIRKPLTVFLDPESVVTSADVIIRRHQRFGSHRLHSDDEFNAQYLVDEGYPVHKIANFFNVSVRCINKLAGREDRAVITQKLFDYL